MCGNRPGLGIVVDKDQALGDISKYRTQISFDDSLKIDKYFPIGLF